MAEDAVSPDSGEAAVEKTGPSVVGLIRFSFLSTNPTEYRQTRDLDIDRRTRHVMDPGRLARRFELFEAVCLPSLAAQPQERFAAVLLTSDRLPDAFRDRLEALLAPHPSIRIVQAAPALPAEAFAAALAHLVPADRSSLTFRLDDDDAIPADYTVRAAAYATAAYEGHCVSFHAGWGIGRVRGRLRVWRRTQPLVSAGLAYVAGPGEARTIYHCGEHQSVAERVPTVLDGRFPGFLQTAHSGNDSGNRVPWPIRLFPNRALDIATARSELAASFPLLASGAVERL